MGPLPPTLAMLCQVVAVLSALTQPCRFISICCSLLQDYRVAVGGETDTRTRRKRDTQRRGEETDRQTDTGGGETDRAGGRDTHLHGTGTHTGGRDSHTREGGWPDLIRQAERTFCDTLQYLDEWRGRLGSRAAPCPVRKRARRTIDRWGHIVSRSQRGAQHCIKIRTRRATLYQ